MDPQMEKYKTVRLRLNAIREVGRELRKKVLLEEGLSETTLRELEDTVAKRMEDTEKVECEDAMLLKVVTPYYIHKNSTHFGDTVRVWVIQKEGQWKP